jgi:hypothetical protein
VIDDRIMPPVKCRVEAGDLWKFWKARQQSANRREVVGLVKGSKRGQTCKPCKDFIVDQHGFVIVGTAVDHTMTNRNRREVLGFLEPGRCHADCGRNICHAFRRIGLVNQNCLVRALHPQSRLCSDTRHLALDDPLQR